MDADVKAAGQRSPAQADELTAAAILLMLLEEEDSAAILASLDPAELRKLGQAMFKVASANEATVQSALDLFVDRCRTVPDLAVGVAPRIRTVMTHALGNVRADNILAEIAPRDSARVLETLRWVEVPRIAEIIRNEHPQVAALILAVLTPEAAAEALTGLAGEIQADLLARAAQLSKVGSQAIADLETILEDYGPAAAAGAAVKVGGRSDAARIVSRLSRADGQRVLQSIKERDEALAQAIENEMVLFSDLGALDARSIGTVLRTVDAAVLTLALRGAEPELAERMLESMSARAAQTIRDEMAEAAPVKRQDVEDAQRQVVAAARRLADAGEIMLGGGADEYV